MTGNEEEQKAQAFEELRAVSEELEPYFQERIDQRREVIAHLEARFADRGLRFTTAFLGDYPVQAFGHLDGMRFYFRFRWGWAKIKVGPYDREIEELHALRINESRALHLEEDRQSFEAGKISEQEFRFSKMLDGRTEAVVDESAGDFLPRRVVASATLQDPAQDSLKGDLSAEEAETFFAQLVENLVVLPEDQQLSTYDQILYYEGWDAAKAWYAGREAELQTQREISREVYG